MQCVHHRLDPRHGEYAAGQMGRGADQQSSTWRRMRFVALVISAEIGWPTWCGGNAKTPCRREQEPVCVRKGGAGGYLLTRPGGNRHVSWFLPLDGIDERALAGFCRGGTSFDSGSSAADAMINDASFTAPGVARPPQRAAACSRAAELPPCKRYRGH